MRWILALSLGFGLTGWAGAAAQASDLSLGNAETKAVLIDVLKSFENSASKDPITQQRIVACLAEQAQQSEALSAYSEFNADQWKSIDTTGMDLSSVVAGLNGAIESCERQFEG
ncbi:MAG: hypothetical protein AAF556_03995 [Pseudomonadota bacterium]